MILIFNFVLISKNLKIN